MKFKKKGGVVGDLVTGTGALIVLTVVIIIIVSTLLGAGLIDDITTTSALDAHVNITATNRTHTVDFASQPGFTSATITTIITNASTGTAFTAVNTNFTFVSGVIANVSIIPAANVTAYQDINVTYAYTYDGDYQATANALSGNFTKGIDNVSGKIPTILLIAAVVLLFGVIVLLVRQSGAMGIGSGEASL